MTPGGEDLKGAFACAGRDACEELLRAVFAEPDEAGAALKVYLRNFSSFNETFGYKRGEALLSEVVAWLAEIPGALVFRAGGGVAFILVLRGAGPVEATAVAQRIADRFEEPWPIGDIDCVLSADTGVVLYPQYAESPGDLFRNLDLALGQSGKMPPGQVTLFGPALKERLYRNS
ncbi:MAG: diguanylate cyclase, partial [Oscillospiraceae bacterium]|nr:diguanylate cyclase [Oscillospiraceae bacterium]